MNLGLRYSMMQAADALKGDSRDVTTEALCVAVTFTLPLSSAVNHGSDRRDDLDGRILVRCRGRLRTCASRWRGARRCAAA